VSNSKNRKCFIARRGIPAGHATAGARKTCETDAGFAATSAIDDRFEATDLEKLRSSRAKNRSAPYSKAAVGACARMGHRDSRAIALRCCFSEGRMEFSGGPVCQKNLFVYGKETKYTIP